MIASPEGHWPECSPKSPLAQRLCLWFSHWTGQAGFEGHSLQGEKMTSLTPNIGITKRHPCISRNLPTDFSAKSIQWNRESQSTLVWKVWRYTYILYTLDSLLSHPGYPYKWPPSSPSGLQTLAGQNPREKGLRAVFLWTTSANGTSTPYLAWDPFHSLRQTRRVLAKDRHLYSLEI